MVDISVTADVHWHTRLRLSHGHQDHVQGSEGAKELRVASTCGQVDADVDRGRQSGDGEEDGEDRGGGSGEHSDEGVEASVPEGEGASPGAALVHGHRGQTQVLAVEVEAVAGQGGEGQGGVALEQHGLGEKHEGGGLEGGELGECLSASCCPLNVPQYNGQV